VSEKPIDREKSCPMAAEAHAPTASEYIVHHLQHLQNVNQTKIVDFTVINYDSIIVGLVLGALTL